MESNTTLDLENSHFGGVYRFGDTDFYLHIIKEGEYELLNRGVGKNITLSFRAKNMQDVQETFDAFFVGYNYGVTCGKTIAEAKLHRGIKKLLGI